MIRRILPTDLPKIPLRDVEHKTLSQVQVIDPKLTPAELAEFQDKLQQYNTNYVQKALSKVLKHIDQEYTKAFDEEDLDALSDQDSSESHELQQFTLAKNSLLSKPELRSTDIDGRPQYQFKTRNEFLQTLIRSKK